MIVKILGTKSFENKAGKTIFMVNACFEKKGVNGCEVASYFTTEKHFEALTAMVGREVDSKKDVAIFYDKNAIYSRKGEDKNIKKGE